MPRLDAHLVATGAARSRERAREAVTAGLVTVNGRVARKAAQSVGPADAVVCAGEAHDYVGRGALKLAAALDGFGVDPGGLVCLDLGASTGGFTEVLLRRGAGRVYAVDVGHGQLAAEVAGDARVVNLERTHARELSAALVPEPVGLLVCDVSFISLTKALPAGFALCAPGAVCVALVKPQFELGPARLGKGGVVREAPEALAGWLRAEIVPWFEGRGWSVFGTMPSPIAGGDGNAEFLVGARLGEG